MSQWVRARHLRIALLLSARRAAPRATSRGRSLFEVAVENAVEGCVRETYGALIAHHQAAHAEDAGIRRAMGSIAEDETRHAALSWKVNAWACGRLIRTERAAMRHAQRAAIDVLRAEVAVEPDPELVSQAGLPAAVRGSALVEQLERELWALA